MQPEARSVVRYYRSGQWYATDGPECWYCYDSAAVGAATLSQQPGGSPSFARTAITTMTTAILRYQLPSGAFANPYPKPDPIGTGRFAVDLGVTYLELRRVLATGVRRAWATAIERAAGYLIESGNTTWYTNGNVNLCYIEVMWLAWAITRESRFLSAYRTEWLFTMSPSQSRWPGFGFHITRKPMSADGTDGAGYLAESGGGSPGFDPSYVDAQLDTATDLYVLTRARQYLWLMNMLFNQLRPRINSAWILDARGGTRRSYLTPFMDPAVSVLASSGTRPDLVRLVSAQLQVVEDQYRGAEAFTNASFYSGFECWIAMPLLSAQWPAGLAPAPDAASGTP
jgi:hypothetical protein